MRTDLPTMLRLVCVVALAATALAACSSRGQGMRESLGLSAPPPDPFLTIARAPLEMPPSLNTLPPPQPGAPSRVEPNPQADAQLALGGGFAAPTTAPGPSAGESALVSASGAADADPAIREQVVAEQSDPERRFGLDSLFGVPIVQDPVASAQRLDPEEEAARLRREGLAAPVPPVQPDTDP